ncbi:MAG: energy transducer TonB [Archangium gephyra]|uniref:Energy transducer TonB n=1 Tax=Archangium gephyra TaxID=48 RepID=A0A2W5TPX3_9BACT|nr:MAG: energy transducer TonB [Archangium gephyra]
MAVLLSFGLAIVVHGALVGLVVLSSLVKWDLPPLAHKPKASNKPVVLRGLTAEQFEQNRGPASAQTIRDERKVIAKKPKLEEKKKEPEKIPPGQVVDTAPGNNQVDEKAKFVSETDNKVAKETRAKDQSQTYRNAAPQRTSNQKIDTNGDAQADKPSIAGNNGLGTDDRPLKDVAELSKLTMKVPDIKKQQEIELKTSDAEGPGLQVSNREERDAIKGNSDRWSLTPGASGADSDASSGHVGQPGAPNLLPSQAVLDKIAGAAPNDYLKDTDEGDGTYLNTRQWKYASFFNRVKQSINQHWNPGDQLRLRDPSGQIYGGRDRYTILAVTLDQNGRLKDAYVEKSSGLDFLDLEAVKAFERAQPFPNPPPGLLAQDSTVKFQFGFMLELGGRPGLRLFRSGQ